VKDEAIRTGLSYAIEGCEEHYGTSRTKTRTHRGWSTKNLQQVEQMEATLSATPTGKVLVDVEKLNKLADGFHGTDGIEIGLCPVCAKKEFHADDCWLEEYWLKEA